LTLHLRYANFLAGRSWQFLSNDPVLARIGALCVVYSPTSDLPWVNQYICLLWGYVPGQALRSFPVICSSEISDHVTPIWREQTRLPRNARLLDGVSYGGRLYVIGVAHLGSTRLSAWVSVGPKRGSLVIPAWLELPAADLDIQCAAQNVGSLLASSHLFGAIQTSPRLEGTGINRSLNTFDYVWVTTTPGVSHWVLLDDHAPMRHGCLKLLEAEMVTRGTLLGGRYTVSPAITILAVPAAAQESTTLGTWPCSKRICVCRSATMYSWPQALHF
jgi:hypothetical protein